MNLRKTLGIAFSAVAILSVSLAVTGVAWQANNAAHDALESAAYAQLVTTRDLQKSQIEQYFQHIRSQLSNYAASHPVESASRRFLDAIELMQQDANGNAAGTATTNALTQYYENDFKRVFEQRNSAQAPIPSMLEALDPLATALQSAYIAGNPNPLGQKEQLDTSSKLPAYDRVHQAVHPEFRRFIQSFGFYDLFLLDPDNGRVIYSVFKELDFATSVETGSFRDSSLASAFREARSLPAGDTAISDFASYLPSYMDPAAFIATPVVINGTTVAVLAIQIPIDAINSIMTLEQNWSQRGLGQSGESYLVGGDLRMRSQSRFLIEDEAGFLATLQSNQIAAEVIDSITQKHSSLGLMPISTPSAKAAINGESGSATIADYRGIEVMSAYAPLDIKGLNWGIIAEMDAAEALQAQHSIQDAILNAAIYAALGIGMLSIIFARLLANRFSQPIRHCVALANSISHGDLSQKIDFIGHSDNEVEQLKAALAEMNHQLSESVGNIQSSAGDLQQSALELSQGNLALAQRTEEQAASLEQTASAIDTLSANALGNAASARDAAALAAEMHSCVSEAQHTMQGVISAIQHLKNSSSQIREVIDLVDDIAFQTNLLALNAAVESARAGEHGRGFAVVAGEVRNLAQRSSGAVRSIENLILENLQRIETSHKQVQNVEEVNHKMLTSLGSVQYVVETIVTASSDQALAVTQINASIQELDQMTQRNAAMVEESAVSARSLQTQAQQLEQEALRFTLDTESALRQQRSTAQSAGSWQNRRHERAQPDQNHRESFEVA